MQFVKDLFTTEDQEFKLLFVEDNIVNREYILEVLRRRFSNIITAENGEQGLELFSKHNPDLVITDIRMPLLDGIAMAEKLKEINPELPIIIVSAFGDREELMKSIRTGITRFILKPVNDKELLAIVEELINLIRLKRKVKLQQQFIETILNSQKVITVLTDGHELLGANEAALSFVGFESLAKLREKHKRFCDFFLDGDDCLSSNEDWLALLRDMPNQTIRIKIRNTASGNIHTFTLTANLLPDSKELYIVSFFDISELESQRRELETLAMIDPLTGVYNRHHFNTILQFNLNKFSRYDDVHTFALLMIDLDHFKKINDTFGHLTGDEVLKEFTMLAGQQIRKSDYLARWGGEEFVVLAPEANLEQASLLADKLRAFIAKHQFKRIDSTVTISIGLTICTKDDNITSIIDRADRALYAAKHAGRNCFRTIQ